MSLARKSFCLNTNRKMPLRLQLFLWNLNEDVEGPLCRLRVDDECILKKIAWSANGPVIKLLWGGGCGLYLSIFIYSIQTLGLNIEGTKW